MFIKRSNIPLIVSILAIAAAFVYIIIPLLHGGFFPTFDDVQVVRIDELGKELFHGQFPVRYVNNFGNGGGYMFFNFYSPLTYYIGAIIHAVHVPLVRATKFVFTLGYLIAVVGTYISLKPWTSRVGRTAGTILFVLSPFLSYEVYTRGTLAEFFGIACLPIFLSLLLLLKEKPSFNKSLLTGIALGVLMYIHSFIAINAAVLGILIFTFPPYNKKQCFYGVSSLLVGGLLSMSFWLPMLIEESYTKYAASYFGSESYKTNLLSILQLGGVAKIPWGFKPPILGIGMFISICVSVVGLFFIKNKSKVYRSMIIGCLASLFLSSNISNFLWDHINFLKMLQFPWRFLAGATVAGIFAIGIFLSRLSNKLAVLFATVLIGLAFLNSSYFRPVKYNYIAVYTADDICSTTTWAQEYLPKWVPMCLPRPKKSQIPLVWSSSSHITDVQETNYGRKIMFQTVSSSSAQVAVRRYYFPGWEVKINGSLVESKPVGKYGLITFTLPKGVSQVQVTWQGSLIENISNIVSGITFIAVMSYFITYYRKKN